MNLNKQSKLYSQGMQPVVKCVGDCAQSQNWERIKEKCSYRSEDNSTVITWIHTVPPENKTTYYAFTYPYTYTELQSFLSILDQRFSTDSSSLYYYRELLTTSLDGSRVDLVTITSHSGKLEEREDRLDDLFPEWSFPRPHRFEGKKVVFVSARVHPGETPSSFVLNGFINFIVSSDSRAKKLRDIFIFKIIPMLNPDGVIRGHYRSDQRGINLNRVYNNPSAKFHPTIYAVKKLILYYHKMSSETTLNVCDDGITSNIKGDLQIPTPEKSTPSLLDEDTCHSFSDAVINKSKNTSTISGNVNKPHSVLDADEPSVSGWDCSSNMSADSLCRSGTIQKTWEEIQEESNKLYSGGETGVTSMFGSMSPLHDFKILNKDTFKSPSKSGGVILNMENLRSNLSDQSDFILSREEPQCDLGISHSSSPKQTSYIFHTDERKESSVLQIPSRDIPSLDKFTTSLHSTNFLSSVLGDSKSNLFMYIDLHGHASKRGIFMYGNWFENPVLMVENMLYPRLLAVNCSNFDFGACNFSERNMYHRDRRDGMSKEGSGRVSVMRATGLIRSYTLECNYNTGRHYTPIPSQGSQGRPLYSVPPKYTPAIFEDCGHKLGISLHNLIEGSDSSKSPSAASIDINSLRTELYNALSNVGVSPRTSNVSSCSISGLTPSPKLGSLKTTKDLKSSSEERTDKTPTSKSKKSLLTKANSPGGTFSQKIGSIYSYTGNRRPSLSSTVDTENQEPLSPRIRSTKPKTVKNKKDTSIIDTTTVKTKKIRYKSSKKLSSSQTLLYKEIGEASHYSSDEKLSSPKHNLCSPIRLPSDIKSESSKLMKKIEKGRKPRTKTLKFGSKKFKNLASSESSSGSFKTDQFSKIALSESDDKLGGTLPIDSCCVSPPNPLSPRSPLASVFEAQTSQTSQASNLNLKQKSTSYVSSSKSTFHSCAKRQPKAIKSIPSSSDRFSAGVPQATGQRLKLFPKKLKKKTTTVGEVAPGKMLSKPTTSQPPLPWVIRKPLKIGGEMESSSSVNPRVIKKRKKSPRKSL
ncbi:Cytosolic carboxypeptidase-like protein 5 [Armadillidium vulgare]|nr:Cytosolic carboxypeptidase-like protein 5 [Armadillidium vulgare]